MRTKTAAEMLPPSMSSRPGYTAGRGATMTDLDSKRLDHIYAEIVEHIGQDAGDNFVDMVQDLEVASCTGFLNSLYNLERAGWNYTKKEKEPNKDHDMHVESEGEAMGAFLSIFGGGNDRDETLMIVSPFLGRFRKQHCTMENMDPRKMERMYMNGMFYRY